MTGTCRGRLDSVIIFDSFFDHLGSDDKVIELDSSQFGVVIDEAEACKVEIEEPKLKNRGPVSKKKWWDNKHSPVNQMSQSKVQRHKAQRMNRNRAGKGR